MGNNRQTGMLVTAQWLTAHLDDPEIRVVDTRKGDGYAVAHIPGSLRYPASVTPFLKEAGRIQNTRKFAELMAEMGIGDDDLVIAYDDGNNLFAARLWWALNYHGHSRVMLLDGGWDLWIAERHPVTDVPGTSRQVRFTPRVDARWIAQWEDVMAAIGTPGRKILDVRTVREWTGADPMGTKRGGHIPSAVHLDWRETIDQVSKRFKPPSALSDMFSRLGLAPEHEVITYCQGGIRAAHAAFALRLAGYDRVRNYERSWSEWGNREDLPIVRPEGAGK